VSDPKGNALRLEPAVELKILDARLAEWGLPRYASASAAAIDLHACLDAPLEMDPGAPAELVPAGFSIFIRDPFIAATILPRSGLGHRQGLVLGNLVGLIDADYQGPILVSVWNRGRDRVTIRPGERIAQMMFVPVIRPRFAVVDAFSDPTARGSGGFGSTGSSG